METYLPLCFCNQSLRQISHNNPQIFFHIFFCNSVTKIQLNSGEKVILLHLSHKNEELQQLDSYYSTYQSINEHHIAVTAPLVQKLQQNCYDNPKLGTVYFYSTFNLLYKLLGYNHSTFIALNCCIICALFASRQRCRDHYSTNYGTFTAHISKTGTWPLPLLHIFLLLGQVTSLPSS